MKFAEFLNNLTILEAKHWDMTSEKILYIDDDLLGPSGLRLTDARLNAIEEKFESLLSN